MSKRPGVPWSGDSCRYHHDFYDTFDPNDCCKELVDYLAKHTEVIHKSVYLSPTDHRVSQFVEWLNGLQNVILDQTPKSTFNRVELPVQQFAVSTIVSIVTTLAALFVSHTVQRKVWSRNTLKEAGLFFTRSTDVLDNEIKQEQKRTGKSEVLTPRAKKEKAIATDSFHTKRENLTKVSFSESKPAHKTSVESLYSGFVTESTSASTLVVAEVQAEEPSKPTLTEFMDQLILNVMNTGLNEMYDTRKSEIVYDEAHLCLMRSIQVIVEMKWNPIIDDFKKLLETMLDDVRRTALERQIIKLRAIDKVPIKVERLRNNYRGFSSEVNQPPTKEEIVDTMKKRKSSFNRYPKDAFGVYISSENERNSSVTTVFSEYEFSSNSLDSIAPSNRSYASTCLSNTPLLPFPRSPLELPTLRPIVDLPVPVPPCSTKDQLIVPTLPNLNVARRIVPTAKSISFEY